MIGGSDSGYSVFDIRCKGEGMSFDREDGRLSVMGIRYRV